MAGRLDRVTVDRNGLELPPKPITGFLTGCDSLWCLKQMHGIAPEQLAAIDRHAEAHQVGRSGQVPPGSAVTGIVELVKQFHAEDGPRKKPWEIQSRLVRKGTLRGAHHGVAHPEW